MLDEATENHATYFKLNNGSYIINIDKPVEKIYGADNEQELQQIKSKAIADGTFLKIRNPKTGELVKSNLNERQWLQVRTKNFINWFGDWINDPTNASKVVDENGEPLVVYHGTDKQNLNEFDNTRNIWFASEVAHEYYVSYPSQRDAHLIPIFVNIKNPSGNISEKFDTDINVRKLQSSRYDGVLPKAFVEGKITKSDIQGLQGFALFSNQIKSATDNNGEFSEEDNNIYYEHFEQNSSSKLFRDKQLESIFANNYDKNN